MLDLIMNSVQPSSCQIIANESSGEDSKTSSNAIEYFSKQ